MISEQSGKNKDFINLSILLTVALFVGIYLIVTTVIIARDGVVFIKYAKQFEISPVKTMVSEYQHPGYPWLILQAHKMTSFLHKNTSMLSWVYCGQGVALIFRLFAVAIFYFIGKQLLGVKMSFWSILILILLPKPAEFGSDVLSDWPHLCLLAAGLLLLFNSAVNNKWWQFGFVGLASGIGYLIRPECVQLVVLGGLWLGLQFFWSKRTMSKGKIISALFLLLVGLVAIAGPYMKLKGAVFPKKNLDFFAQSLQQSEVYSQNNQSISETVHASYFEPTNITKALCKLGENVVETLMWFFFPALLIGMYKWFKLRKWHEPEAFFIIGLIVLNVPVMIWLYCRHGYISDRHTLPLLILPILFVPVGLQELAIFFEGRFSRKVESSSVINHDTCFWFLVLFLVGISVCVPKLFRPIRINKQGYRAAATWLKANTDTAAIVAVPDKRINFYAERKGFVYKNGNIPANALYVVSISENQKEEKALIEPLGKVEYKYVSKRKKGVNVIIYRNLQDR
jgi:4-amino-4-deoxy-L-arabinose transferase-like glycosyltransferase